MSESIQGKGRPTPKRNETQKRRGGPVPPPPTNRRAAAKALRAKQAVQRKQTRQGTAKGDEATLLKRDQGPVRRRVRDIIDGRRNLGFLLLPVALLLVVAQAVKQPALLSIVLGLWLATLLGVALDLVLIAVAIRRAVRADFPNEGKLLGHTAYGLLRSTVIRRFRMPPPKVTRGARS